MKLLFQSDDYGITEGITFGVLKGIREGLIRNTGLFVNMPSSKLAAGYIKDYPQCCFGLDINLVAGKPLSDPSEVPSLIKPSGEFYTSGEIFKKTGLKDFNDLREIKDDPYPLEETLVEVEKQMQKFIELVGKEPGYIHPHSLMTPNTERAIAEVGKKYGVRYSMDLYKQYGFEWVAYGNGKPASIQEQLDSDVEGLVLQAFPDYLDKEYVALICHAGFVDEDIFRCSTYNVLRAKDLFMACSPKVKEFVEANHIELITYNDLQ